MLLEFGLIRQGSSIFLKESGAVMSAVPLLKVCETISAAFTAGAATLLISEVSARHASLSNHSGEIPGRDDTHEAADER